jgi:SAM-dependent methyltransferase
VETTPAIVYRRAMPRAKIYDREYFDRWYRDPRHSPFEDGVLPRRVQLAVAATEYLIERPIQTVLDVGCGEGPWRALLRHARPRVRYVGVDSSEYVVRRFGRLRNIRLGRFGELGRIGLRGPFDLIICSDVLHYVPTPEARRGLRAIARLLGGVAFIEVFTPDDDTVGDGEDFQRRSAASYRRLFREARLVHLGLHCYAGRALRNVLTTFERAVG